MALDNAEFISELSIIDPPGTDPLNQGDDHIRTTKKAVQQSFPNVDAPVPQSAAQMAQMAIKNEVNIFTQNNTFQQLATFNNDITLDSGGTTVINFDKAVSRRWQWLYNGPSDALELRRFVAGALIDAPMSVNNAFGEFTFLADASFGRTLLAADGVAAAPAFRFTNSTNMGMYRIANGILGLSPNGTEQFRMTSVFAQFAGVLHAPDGIETAPGYAFTSDLGTGVWASASSLNLSANGQTIASFTSSSDIFAAVGRSWAANSLQGVGRPGFNFNSDPDTGFYNPGANVIGITTGGVAWGTMDGTALWLANGRAVRGKGDGTFGNPAFSFTNDTDTGIYRHSSGILGFTGNNSLIGTWGQGGFGVSAGVPVFLSLPSTPGIGGSLWVDLTDSKRVKVV